MRSARVLFGITLVVAVQVVAQAPNSVTATVKLTSELQKVLEKQSGDILKVFETVDGDLVLTGEATAVEAAWEAALHKKLKAQLEEKDSAILGLVALSDADASVRISKAAAETRAALDLGLTKALVAKRVELTTSLADQGTRSEKLKAAQKALNTDELKPGLDDRQEKVLAAFRNVGIDTVRAEVQAKLDAERTAMERQFLEQFSKEKGVSKIVRCQVTSLDTSNPNLTCKPDGLRLGGMSVAHVRISGLPANQVVTVRADLTETTSRRTAGNNTPGPACVDLYGGKCDFFEYAPMGASGTRDVVVLVHTDRHFSPTYETEGGKTVEKAMMNVRKAPTEIRDRSLQLVSRGKGLELGLRVTVGDKVLSTSVPVAYERWKFETATMFAVNNLVDQRLVTTTDSTGVKVDAKRDVDNTSQETVLFLSLVPANYEIFAVGFGLHTSSDRNVSYYFGGSVRLLSLGERALASFSAGLLGAEVRQFPEVELTKTYPANDARLQGDLRYKYGWYIGISLGFRFGPLGGGDDGAQ